MGLLHFAAVQKHDGSVSAPPFFLSKSNPLRRDLILYPGNEGHHAPVAQQAEHLPFKQGVRGSNPRWSTRKRDRHRRSCFLLFQWDSSPRTPNREAILQSRRGEAAGGARFRGSVWKEFKTEASGDASLRWMRSEFAEKQPKIGASCAGRRGLYSPVR